jgi:hypothetical protein
MTEKELLAAILQKLTERMIPIEVDLWDNEHVAAYLKRSYTAVRDKIIVRPDFPRPPPKSARIRCTKRAR